MTLCTRVSWNTAALFLLSGGALWAQSLTGAIDIHVHSDPDSTARSIDALDVAKLAKSRGMRGLVLKNHYAPTAGLAYIIRKVVPGIEVFGGISLDRTVGGVNPAAVDYMARMKGGLGRVVWMPTFDSENQVRFDKANRPFVSVSRNGKLLPEVNETLAVIAKYKLVLETGHSSPAECLMLIRAGKAAGVTNMVVTHAMMPPIKMNIDQMKQAAAMGAYIEFVYHGLLEHAGIGLSDYVAAIRAVGPEHCILSSDLGQAGSPLHPDGLLEFYKELHAQGFSVAEIDRMGKANPAKILGLE
jgi:hypothetical protein